MRTIDSRLSPGAGCSSSLLERAAIQCHSQNPWSQIPSQQPSLRQQFVTKGAHICSPPTRLEQTQLFELPQSGSGSRHSVSLQQLPPAWQVPEQSIPEQVQRLLLQVQSPGPQSLASQQFPRELQWVPHCRPSHEQS